MQNYAGPSAVQIINPPVAAGGSRPGRGRQRSQDAWWAARPEWVSPAQLADKGYLYLVADGISGQAAGEAASRAAVECMVQAYYADPNRDMAASLARAVRAANQAVLQLAQQPAYRGMGTTLVAAAIRGQELVVAHAGDSRAYLLRAGTLQRLTTDHSWVAEKVSEGLLTPREAASHPQRNIITRSLGSQPDLEPEVRAYTFQPGDRLLLCTDGVWGQVPEAEMARCLAARPDRAASRLIKQATAGQETDDATAVVAALGPARTGPAGVILEALSWPQQWVVIGLVGAVLIVALFLYGVGRLAMAGEMSATATAMPSATPASSPAPAALTPSPAPATPRPAIASPTPAALPIGAPTPAPTSDYCITWSGIMGYAVVEPNSQKYDPLFSIGSSEALDNAYPSEIRLGCADTPCVRLEFVRVVYRGQPVWILKDRLGTWQEQKCVAYRYQ